MLLLTVWPATAQRPDPPRAPTPTAARSPSRLSLGFHLDRGDGLHMEAARAAGGNFAVVVFNWANIEPTPNYVYWETPDAALRAAEFYGLEVIARLDQPPAWALDPASPTPWNLEAYVNFVRRVTDRYGERLAGVVIWNEPNLSLEWNDQPPHAAAYVEMLEAAYPVVKAVAPDLPVLMAGLASTEGEGDWAINDLDYLQAVYAAGAGPYFDILTAHPYGFGRPPADPPEKFRPNFRRLELYREIMAAHGDAHKPVWVTEMGWLIRAGDPEHDWQVVTPQVQADYILKAIDYANDNYPWVERLGLWQLDSGGDEYGYGIWSGPEQSSPAYEALVETCEIHSTRCPGSRPRPAPDGSGAASLEILSPETIIRLGDRGMLHPHWVHLHRGGQTLSPTWQGEFFLTAAQAGQPYDLVVETMQIDQATNRLLLNGEELARLRPRPRLDPTSAWVTQRFSVSPEMLRPGRNTLAVAAGLRNPARQYVEGRWENMQFRNIRLVKPDPPEPPLLANWRRQPAPSGWSETNRLRAGLANALWLTGIHPGQLWRGVEDKNGEMVLTNQAGARSDFIFNDLLPTVRGELAATGQGLLWRSSDQNAAWQPIDDAPTGYAHVLARANGRFYAGFEEAGLWSAPALNGPWQPTGLTATTVIDLVTTRYQLPGRLTPVERLYAVTGAEIFVNDGLGPDWRVLPLPALSAEALAEAGESPGDKLQPRLYLTAAGRLLVRHQDRLWLQREAGPAAAATVETGGSEAGRGGDLALPPQPGDEPARNAERWELFGPDRLAGKIFSVLNCCGPGALAGGHETGIWQLTTAGTWRPFDKGFFKATDITRFLQLDRTRYAAGELGLFRFDGGAGWQKVEGLPEVISDLVIDPADPTRWLAATPAGVYRSRDGGAGWEAVSPPWTVWDLTFGPQGRLFAGRNNGLAWADALGGLSVRWQTAEGMERVYFLSVNPHPVEPDIVWAGTWGNNIAVSSDGGRSIEPLHNGLETLSGLDLIWHPTPGQVTLATIEGLYRTDDGGRSWFKLPGLLQQQTIHALLQSDDGTIWAGAADGLWASRDYGVTWERAAGFPPATVLRLGRVTVPPPSRPETPPSTGAVQSRPADAAASQWLWAGTERAGLWLSRDGGKSWRWAGLPERTVYNLLVDPLQPGRLVAATDRGIWAVPVR